MNRRRLFIAAGSAVLLMMWVTTAVASGEQAMSPELRVDSATAAGFDQPNSNDPPVNPYAQMSLDELMGVQVTSVSGWSQSWFTTPAAIYVITPEDIQHIGAQSIPEALRIVPGLDVAQVDARRYAISARGFNNPFANKLQVLVDGRSIYEPSFAGVYWDQYDTILQDLQQIEVIRGPGATLWGSNAVNGVINITTKNARDTQGWLLSGSLGAEQRYTGQVRYGDAIDNDTWFRVWAKYVNHDASYNPVTSNGSGDQWDAAYGGFRIDHQGADNAMLTLSGGFQASASQHNAPLEPVPGLNMVSRNNKYIGEMYGGYLLGKIDNDLQHPGGWQLHGYIDINQREDMGDLQERHMIDLDFRHHLNLGGDHDILWGLGARYTHSDLQAQGSTYFTPQQRDTHLLTAFVQDTLTLEPNRWFFMFGSKFEHNSFTGFDAQPGARLWWTPNDHQTLWTSISRAVRIPSLVENDIHFTQFYGDNGLLHGGPADGNIVPVELIGNRNLKPEELLAMELGYRQRFGDELTISVSGFANRYNRLISSTAVSPTETQFVNGGTAESYGVEVSTDWRISDNWRLTGSYSYLSIFAHGGTSDSLERDTPQHQFNLRTQYSIGKDLDLNAALYFCGEREGPATRNYLPSPSYTRLDVGLTWRPMHDLEISVWGLNLLDPHHAEYTDTIFSNQAFEIQRSFYVQVTYRF